jgi:DNA-directed RNA polymerase subunit delta
MRKEVPMLSLEQYSKEQLKEMSMIEMAYESLKIRKQPVHFNEIVDEIAAAAGLTADQVRTRIAQFYTDLNIDGRFISLGENKWGLRVWYPVDTVEEDNYQVAAAKPKKKKAKKAVAELDDYEELEEEADYDDLDEEDVLDEEEDSFDDLDAEDDEEEFDLDEDEAIDEDLDEDIDEDLDEDLDDDLEESLEALEEEELEADDEDEDL